MATVHCVVGVVFDGNNLFLSDGIVGYFGLVQIQIGNIFALAKANKTHTLILHKHRHK